MKKINLFNRNTNSPSYRRMPVSRGFKRGGGIPLFSGMTAVIFALFIATPSFATPTELDKKTVASKAYVDTKQDKIPAGTYGANASVVTYNSTAGDVQERWIMGAGTIDEEDPQFGAGFYKSILNNFNKNTGHLTSTNFGELNNGGTLTRDQVEMSLVPAKYIASALAYKQAQILPTHNGTFNTPNYVYDATTNPTADGSVVVTTGATGTVDQRGIATAPTYDNSNQLTNGNWLPTMSALVNQISAAVDKLTWTATETTATQQYSTTFDGTTNNWPAADANKIIDGTALANGLAQKQNKMVCAGWDSETHTDEHCWLWSIE